MLRKLFYCIALVFLLLSLVLVVKEFWMAFGWMTHHLKVYMWFFIGIAAYYVLRLIPQLKKNEEWLQVFSHELSHTIVGLMLFQRIHSFQAGEKSGVVYHSGRRFGETFISLAPYYLPIFTFAFLLFRIIGAWKSLYIFDTFIGFSLAFHCLCFIKQTRPYQTDISSVGYLKAYLFIACALLFNLTIILLSIRKGIVNANVYLFTHYWNDIVQFINHIF